MRESLKYPVHVIASATILFVVLTLAMSSCIAEYPDSKGYANEEMSATMRLFLSLDSRSYEADGFEEGVEYENFIDINNDDYRIYFFDSDKNTFIGVFEPLTHPSVSLDNISVNGGLIFNGSLIPEIGNRFKLVVLANWPVYPEVVDATDSGNQDSFTLIKDITTIKDLTTHFGSRFNALSSPANGTNWLGKGRLMPFYGVRSFDLNETHRSSLDSDGKVLPGKIIDLSYYPIPLLRAMAKVEVLLDHPYASFESVEMSRINEQGYSAPFNEDNQSDNWKFDYSDYYSESGGWSGNYKRGVHLVSGSGVSTLAFTKVVERTVNEDGSVTPEKWVAYMPEYSNHGNEPTSVIVRLNPSSVVGGDGNENRLRSEFFFTSDGEVPHVGSDASDIERNNIYRFKVGIDGTTVDIQPYTEHNLRFEFGLVRDERGDLMVLPIPERDVNGNIVTDENGNPVMTYPQYFLNFINDEKPNHKYPKECNADGEEIPNGDYVKLEDGDYYAIVVGENESMDQAEIWVKDRNGCRVLSNYSSVADSECSARLVKSFYGNNQSEVFYKDVFGFRRVYHFANHNSIVIHPENNNMLFRVVENFGESGQTLKYYEVESWDDYTHTGWVINKDPEGNDVGFQEITSAGLLGDKVDLNGNSMTTND